MNHTSSVNEPVLMKAAHLGHAYCPRLLLDAGADVNRVDSWGKTALEMAAMNGKVDCVTMLIESGADVSMTGNAILIKAAGPLGGVDHAKLLSVPAVIKVLLKAGAHVNKTNSDHRNAL